MKKAITLILLVFILCACQKESLTVKETPEETSFLKDAQLVTLMQSVASHDGRFDNAVDKADCFSIDFPYRILLNGASHEINAINDLLIIDPSDTVSPVFPINITFANYVGTTVSSEENLQILIDRCLQGILYNDRITCVDFVYPVYVAVFDLGSSDFETISFDHDKDTFLTLTEFASDALASIHFPVQMITSEENIITISSNKMLKNFIEANEALCP